MSRVAIEASDRPRENPVKPGTVRIEVIGGVEGPCLSVCDADGRGGFRIAGPKPWGGGNVTKAFTVRGERSLMALKAAVDLALSQLGEHDDA